MMLGGIDGSRAGWLLAYAEGNRYDFDIIPTFNLLLRKYPNFSRIFIDIPIGLSSMGFERTIDGLLRQQLKRRASTVFTPPCREALKAPTFQEANQINRQITGKGISIQSWNIGGKIQEVDTWLKNHPNHTMELLESSPELCFKMLNDGNVLLEKKSETAGIQKREALIKKQGIKYIKLYQLMRQTIPSKKAKPDDMLDALSLLIRNEQSAQQSNSFLEDANPVDKKGIKIRIAF